MALTILEKYSGDPLEPAATTSRLSTPVAYCVQGLTGSQGVQGIIGAQGLEGAQGLQGTTGLGVQGTQGTIGISVQGTQGVQGTIGVQGSIGSQGLNGIQGTIGFWNEASLGSDFYWNPSDLNRLDVSTIFLEDFQLQGIQGSSGAQGLMGVQGFAGIQGAQGKLGIQGVQGTIGTQGLMGVQGTNQLSLLLDVSIKDVSTYDALIYDTSWGLWLNTNTLEASTLSLQGVQGTIGAGVQGTMGIQGAQGVGIQGIQGKSGSQGVQGTIGIQGLIGVQGTIGFWNEASLGSDFYWNPSDLNRLDVSTIDIEDLFYDGISIGTPPNYVNIDASGHLKLIGEATAWDDLVVPLTTSKQDVLTLPDFSYTELAYLFPQNDPSEILYFVIQLPHKWKQGSTLYPHVHYRQKEQSNKPTFKLDYKIANIGASMPNTWKTYTMDASVMPWVDSSTHQLAVGVGGLDASTYTLSAMMLCKLYRQDNLVTGDVPTWQFDLHYEIDSFGSNTEYTK